MVRMRLKANSQSDAPIHEQRGFETRAAGRKLVNGSSQPEVMLLAKWQLSIARS